jgi:protoheme ferro-lyase
MADCLETVWEIGVDMKSRFLKRGGKVMDLVPALNADENLVKYLSKKVQVGAKQESSRFNGTKRIGSNRQLAEIR